MSRYQISIKHHTLISNQHVYSWLTCLHAHLISLRIPVSLESTPVDIHSLQLVEVASTVGRNPTMEVSMCLPKVGNSFFHDHHVCKYANASKELESTCLCHRHLHHNKHHRHGRISRYKRSAEDMQRHYPVMNLPQPRGTTCGLKDPEPEVPTPVNRHISQPIQKHGLNF